MLVICFPFTFLFVCWKSFITSPKQERIAWQHVNLSTRHGRRCLRTCWADDDAAADDGDDSDDDDEEDEEEEEEEDEEDEEDEEEDEDED